MMAANVREMALDLLLKVEREKGYSNLVLNRMIENINRPLPTPPCLRKSPTGRSSGN